MNNLVLITIDAWRADFVDEFNGVPLTPTLAPHAQAALRCDNTYANGPWTSPPLISVFTGQGSGRHGVHYEWDAPRPGGPALARRLVEAGYEVPNLCYLNRVGNYQNLGYAAAESPGYPHGVDDDLLLPALRSRRESARPFFLWYHYKYVHLPYWPAEPFRRALGIEDDAVSARLRESVCKEFVVPRQRFQLLPEDQPMLRRLYAANVLQMDAWLGRVLDEVRGGPLGDRTHVIVTADHGDELLEHGHVGHASTAHHAHLYEEVLRIPLLFFGPGIKPGRRAERVQGADLYPTMLGLAGVPGLAVDPAEGACDGVDLRPLLRGEPLQVADDRPFYFRSSRRGYQTPRAEAGQEVEGFSDGRRKLIVERYDGPERVALYDLKADPGETRPLEDKSDPEVVGALTELSALRAAQAGAAGADRNNLA